MSSVASSGGGRTNAKSNARELLYELSGNSGGGGGGGSGSVVVVGNAVSGLASGSGGSGGGGGGAAGIECPSFDDSSACPCYKFEDGLFLECPGTTALSLRSTLERISAPIHSLSIYDFDRSVTSLSHDVFQPGVHIRHLQFSHSHLEALKDNSLRNVGNTLESLSIVNGKLTQLPSRALGSLKKLTALDFDYNEIVRIDDYSFYGLRLSKLNIKGNSIQSIPQHGFTGLEESIQEIDLSENGLRTFPMMALRKLGHLRILRLSNNKISTFYGDIQLATNNASAAAAAAAALQLPSLIFLDLSSNQFSEIVHDCFRAFPQLKTLSFYSNQIELVQPEAFKSLKELMSLDMSHNRIIALDPKVFDKSKRLQTVDLSHNHIHAIGGVFSNLPQLREVFLSENNILELPADAFTNSTNVDVIYLESNAIAHIDPNVFSTLLNLDHLYLRSNFIPLVPVTLFDKCTKLSSLSLDNNEIQDLEIGMFRKLDQLREVRLHNNRIRRVRKGVFEPLPALQELHIQKNNIEDIEPGAFQTLANMQHINLQDNQLTVLEDIFPNGHPDNSSLLSIQLEANYLHKIHQRTFRQQQRIQIMWLRDNQLTKIDKSLFVDTAQLGRLYLSNNHIREIEKDTFASLSLLKFLDLSSNKLRQLRRDYFAALQSLEELNLAQNYIEAIEGYAFNKLKQLKTLDLSNNPLTQIARDIFMDELPLTVLNLRNTSLRKLEMHTFKSLQNLNELNFEYNHLNPADIQKLDVPSLRRLHLSHNNFSHVGMGLSSGSGGIMAGMFDKLRSLQHLSMANCSLSVIPDQLFVKNTNLVRIDLCDNLITTMNRNIFSGLNVFKELRLCRNSLVEFPHIALYNLSTLETLDLARNQLTSIDFFKLSGTLNLRQLILKDNKITSLSGFNAVNLTQLDNVDLSGNLLLSLPANFLRHSINLQRVDLSSNRFLQIPSSALSDVSIPRLSWLNLTGNPINKIYTVKEERYPYLKELYICQTNLSILTSKDFEAFQALQHLHLVNNRITRISPGAFKSLTNLLTLDISVNELEMLPKERLQGLKLLRLLNISHNTLKDLEEFSTDLAQLQTLDLSFNQLDRISKKTFRNLHGLVELLLMGNRMTVLSNDAFRYLRKLHVLDLRKNYFELVPLEPLRPLETNIRTLKLEENPLHCSCDAQKLWEWLRDHRKWSLTPSGDNINYLRCEHPTELRGKVFGRMEPQQFCDAPLIPKMAIQDIQPYSVVVSWQSREHLGLNGFEIVYHATGDNLVGTSTSTGTGGVSAERAPILAPTDEIHGKRLNGTANSTKLTKLSPNTRYHICVIGTGNWLSEPVANALQKLHQFNETFVPLRDDLVAMAADLPAAALPPLLPEPYSPYQPYHHQQQQQQQQRQRQQNLREEEQQQQQALIENTIITDNVLQEVLKNSHISACTDVQTLDSTPSLITDENGLSSNGFIHSILTRRLGLIVGCCLGIIVFIVMISVLSYVKLKKQRIENAKRQAAMPPEYISYRHFSIPNEELTRTAANANSAAAAAAVAAAAASGSTGAGNATHMSSVPSGISAHISGTSLSTGTTTTTATTPIGGVPKPSGSPIVGIVGLVVDNGSATSGATAAAATTIALSGDIVSVATAGAGTTVSIAPAASSPANNGGHTHNHNHHSHHLHQQQQPQHCLLLFAKVNDVEDNETEDVEDDEDDAPAVQEDAVYCILLATINVPQKSLHPQFSQRWFGQMSQKYDQTDSRASKAAKGGWGCGKRRNNNMSNEREIQSTVHSPQATVSDWQLATGSWQLAAGTTMEQSLKQPQQMAIDKQCDGGDGGAERK
ncbi:chaoptin [Scaptodrosophila lebanonensis]|uniref:Chaoptin n=1 Tax=Drosophila lebanonensis TaxID=7225 RepID=A0A6J2U0S6_DROLE|nr:chaoptin [Scaptodrosophila lebanonensis]